MYKAAACTIELTPYPLLHSMLPAVLLWLAQDVSLLEVWLHFQPKRHLGLHPTANIVE